MGAYVGKVSANPPQSEAQNGPPSFFRGGPSGRCAFMICHDEREAIVTYVIACCAKAAKYRLKKAK